MCDPASFAAQGFAVFPAVLDDACVQWVCGQIESAHAPRAARVRDGQVYALRGVFDSCPGLLPFAQSGPLAGLASALLGGPAWPTKATLFDKRPGANWHMPFHQDLAIAVARRVDVDGFTNWSEKGGILHVQPPDEVLESLVALRVHLDACGPGGGALRVIPGSHRHGRLTKESIAQHVAADTVQTVSAAPGDVIAMRPLLLHGSGKMDAAHRRRVLHIEYSARQLPAALDWPTWTGRVPAGHCLPAAGWSGTTDSGDDFGRYNA